MLSIVDCLIQIVCLQTIFFFDIGGTTLTDITDAKPFMIICVYYAGATVCGLFARQMAFQRNPRHFQSAVSSAERGN